MATAMSEEHSLEIDTVSPTQAWPRHGSLARWDEKRDAKQGRTVACKRRRDEVGGREEGRGREMGPR